MSKQVCVACYRSLKASERTTLASSEEAITFISTFEDITDSTIHSALRSGDLYLCKPCLKKLEGGVTEIARLEMLLSQCRHHFGLSAITIKAVERDCQNSSEDFEGNFLQPRRMSGCSLSRNVRTFCKYYR